MLDLQNYVYFFSISPCLGPDAAPLAEDVEYPELSGSETSGPESSGLRASGPKSSGPESSGLRASGPKSSGPESSGLRASGPKSSGSESSGLQASGPKSSGLRASGPKSSGLQASGPESSGLRASGPESSGLRASLTGDPGEFNGPEETDPEVTGSGKAKSASLEVKPGGPDEGQQRVTKKPRGPGVSNSYLPPVQVSNFVHFCQNYFVFPMCIHCKKRLSVFPSPAGMSLT
jgi:hypothetical protein